MDHIILGHLHAIRGDSGAIRSDIADLKLRVGPLEEPFFGMRPDMSPWQSDIAVTHKRLDHDGERSGRLERTLEITS